MQSENRESFLNSFQKSIIILFFTLIICFIFLFKNLLFESTFLLKNFGKLSVEPQIAFKNNRPTFLEFYAEWCEVCKEMAPKVAAIKDEYEADINFVFLNVDNPKWENYIKQFNVNGIPQVNLFDSQANIVDTFIGKQEEKIIKRSLEKINDNFRSKSQILNSEFSVIKENNNYLSSPRSHG